MTAGAAGASKASGCGCGCKECASGNPTRTGLAEAASLYRRFNRFGASRVVKVKHPRVMPPVVVELGPLAGLIYRSNKGEPGQKPRTYIHIMEQPPRLVSNVEGTQLYIVGGNYRVSRRGVEG